MFTRSDLIEWANDHGYMHYICPRCHRHFWTDSNEPCPSGCFDFDWKEKAKQKQKRTPGNPADAKKLPNWP